MRVEPATELNAVLVVGRDRQCIVHHTYGRKLELRIADGFIDRGGKSRRETVRGNRREVDRDGDISDSKYRWGGQWVGVDDLEAYGISKAIGQEHRVAGRKACEGRLHEDFVGTGLNSSDSAQGVRQIESMAAGSTERENIARDTCVYAGDASIEDRCENDRLQPRSDICSGNCTAKVDGTGAGDRRKCSVGELVSHRLGDRIGDCQRLAEHRRIKRRGAQSSRSLGGNAQEVPERSEVDCRIEVIGIGRRGGLAIDFAVSVDA